jgi:hypothetical protein
MLQNEEDARIKAIWELHLDMEIGQLHAACDLLRRYEGIEPEELLPKELPDTPVTFEPNKEYVREVLEATVNLRPDGPGYTSVEDMPDSHRFFAFQEVVNAGGTPSEQVIDQNRTANGAEYRDETEGPHPFFPMPARSGAAG